MKTFRNISMFMITASIIYAAGAYTGNWFYPNRSGQEHYEEYTAQEKEDEIAIGGDMTKYTGNSDAVQPVARQENRLNADTEYIIEEYDMALETLTEVEQQIPAKYIGMDREAFIEAMAEYEMAPSMTDLEKGFLSLEVLSFAPEKVVVRKNYQTGVRDNRFCLAAEDNYVVVYYGDLSTLFMHTDIALSSLPKELQEEIIQVKYMEGERELYHFLESYSS